MCDIYIICLIFKHSNPDRKCPIQYNVMLSRSLKVNIVLYYLIFVSKFVTKNMGQETRELSWCITHIKIYASSIFSQSCDFVIGTRAQVVFTTLEVIQYHIYNKRIYNRGRDSKMVLKIKPEFYYPYYTGYY